ncbi:MAG: hypothetical protein DWQ36_25805 [Acidobacteria bacterium]|mgnify:CR=1 FL=1|nr:MAG: hypothetical protein DWQ30_17630 [Acidobacteriota bacterium]REJ99428.1 MAG: hypothetical protein DWQ36_25805 [Acidobacteriota bacterium]
MNRSARLGLLVAWTWASGAHAATFVVDTEADGMVTGCSPLVIGDCTLRGAIQRANQNVGFDTITFGFGVRTIELTLSGAGDDLNQTGDLDILEDLLIDGNGVVTVDATAIEDRVFDVSTNSTAFTVIEGLTISGGRAPTGDGSFDGGGVRCLQSALFLDHVVVGDNGPVRRGGGVYAQCDVIANFTTFSDNVATQAGGGLEIFSDHHLSAPVSAFVGNHAAIGGGLSIGMLSTAAIDNTTFSGNTATNGGTAIHNSSQLELDFVTVFDPQSAIPTIAHLNLGATTAFSNSLVVGSCAAIPGNTLVTLGGNLESPGDTCLFDPMLDQFTVADARLSPLGDNGGPTPSHMPRADSPAVDDPLGTISNCPAHDQRFGPPRPLDGNGDGLAACDIGAIERDVLFDDGFESGDLSEWSLATP